VAWIAEVLAIVFGEALDCSDPVVARCNYLVDLPLVLISPVMPFSLIVSTVHVALAHRFLRVMPVYFSAAWGMASGLLAWYVLASPRFYEVKERLDESIFVILLVATVLFHPLSHGPFPNFDGAELCCDVAGCPRKSLNHKRRIAPRRDRRAAACH